MKLYKVGSQWVVLDTVLSVGELSQEKTHFFVNCIGGCCSIDLEKTLHYHIEEEIAKACGLERGHTDYHYSHTNKNISEEQKELNFKLFIDSREVIEKKGKDRNQEEYDKFIKALQDHKREIEIVS